MGKKKRKRSSKYNKIAMIGICFVVCVMLLLLFIEGKSVQKKIEANDARQQELTEQIEEEKERTEEIEKMQDYMQSDEYTEKIAKEKIGLLKENEIIFKEED